MTWSSDDYSAALVGEDHGRLLRRRSVNTVPVGALVAGLRRAGFVPHTLLRVPLYAVGTPLPPPCHKARAFFWYDQRQVAGMGVVSVRASLSASDIGLALFFLFFIGAVGVTGLTAAVRVGRDERLPISVRRRRYKALAQYPVFGAIALHMPFMLIYLHTPHPQAVSDLWFSSSSFSVLVPFLVVGPLAMALLLPITVRQETRLFGPAAGAAVVPMSPEERAIRRRMARWTMVPHLLAVCGIAAGLFLLPRRSPLYPVLHPLSQLLPVLGAVVIGRFFRKPLAAFTRITPDEGLTWRARQLGMQMGVCLQEVQVEDSSRAAHYVSLSNERGGYIRVSRKTLEIMSPAKLDFLLAHQVALMKVKASLTPLTMLLLLPGLLPVAFGAWVLTGHAALAAFALMPYALLLMFLPFVVMMFLSRRGNTPEARRVLEADRVALAVTGDAAAAQSALTKLTMNSPAVRGQVLEPGAFPAAVGRRLKALGAPASAA